jgi:hypothetical protein
MGKGAKSKGKGEEGNGGRGERFKDKEQTAARLSADYADSWIREQSESATSARHLY